MPAESKAFRSATTGDRGFMLERGGKSFIRLDRPGQVVERQYKEDEWIAEDEHRPLLPHQLGRIYFEAEKHLLIALGEPEGREMDWQFMNNNARNHYLEDMHLSENPLVVKLHKAMKKILGPLGR